ncbi:hypothetical protein C447_12290 [Halococcus hamelinensis 100A6]|uniref:Uncharacterized protein n=1 Tax=Halococcus hamelinensis 100A6 TaxID=1132509 RepID=M0LVY7_9EURY|nr:hypothetical protein [Halococcus hamelinensis]EMA37752.1 hypothetical protein C447_12290 [Halococcus hamelinensis 100A6]
MPQSVGCSGKNPQERALEAPGYTGKSYVLSVPVKHRSYPEQVGSSAGAESVQCFNRIFELARWAKRRPDDERSLAAVADSVRIARCNNDRLAREQDALLAVYVDDGATVEHFGACLGPWMQAGRSAVYPDWEFTIHQQVRSPVVDTAFEERDASTRCRVFDSVWVVACLTL